MGPGKKLKKDNLKMVKILNGMAAENTSLKDVIENQKKELKSLIRKMHKEEESSKTLKYV